MRQEVVCSHCQESFHVHFKSFLLGRLECPHCHSHFRLIPSWTVCFLLAILVVILPDDHAFAGLIVYLLILFILFYLFLPFWVRNHLMKIQPVTKKQD
jgi:Na+/melibiose symporter-like transporter